MRASEAWLIYILSVLVIYVLLTICGLSHFDNTVRLFISFLIAAIIIFILAPSTTEEDRAWIGLLYIVAFVLPLVFAIWLIFVKRNFFGLTGNENVPLDTAVNEGNTIVERTIECDRETGECELVDERQYQVPSRRPSPSRSRYSGVTTRRFY